MSFPRSLLLSAALAALVPAASAQTPAVRLDLPPGVTRSGDTVMMQPIPDGAAGPVGDAQDGTRASRIRVLSPADHDLFLRAFLAADKGDWTNARALAAQGQSATARQLLEWRYALARTSGATFAEIDAVLRGTGAAWPLRNTLYVRAEAALDPSMAPADMVAWFGARNPASAIGRIRLGEALVATGERARGCALIARGWAEGAAMDLAIEQAVLANDAACLTPDSDRDRMDALLWRGDVGAARRQLARVDGAAADIASARITLYASGWQRTGQPALDKVQGSTDPNLLFDWSRALRQADRDAEAHAMLLRIAPASLVRDHAARWWTESSIQARDALTAGQPRQALEIAQHAGFTTGDQYADQQFLIGFIALRFVKDPATALAAFQKLEAGVSRPISKSRAFFWQGRAHEAMGQSTQAAARYRLAAAYPETFYGQVALAKLDPTPVLRLNETAVEAAGAAEVEADPLVQPARVLADLGQGASLRSFIERIAETRPGPSRLKRLMMMTREWGYPEIALRLGKTASYAGAYLPEYTHPVIALPAYPGPGAAPEPALVLGLIRQETEFDAYAVSSAGARGLMQMMPASAKLAAKQANLPYRPQALLSDTTYNMQLGMTEYRGHLDKFGGSYVLAAAGYNAGPNNARKWVAAYGDPRVSDPIDWIEQIPFGETRNYVQRVLENMEVYRVRLAGKEAPLRILPDLYAPGTPPPR